MQKSIAIVSGRSVVSSAIARGIGAYAQKHDLPWALVTLEPDQIQGQGPSLSRRLQAPYDGIVGFIPDGIMRGWVASKRCPVIQYAGIETELESCVTIRPDDEAIGVMAARYLLDQGYRSFACAGRWSIAVIARRFDAFIAELARRGHGCAIDDQDGHHDPSHLNPEQIMASWLRSLPQPVALFFHQDRAALYATELCAAQGLRVPEHVAILGVDNVSDACEASRPPLSSIALPWTYMGELGALHLHRMINGEPGGKKIFVPPLRVVTRASTSRPKVSDPLAARCLQYLERHVAKPIRIPELARQLGVDRSTLHRHVVAATDCSPGEYLHRLRCERASELLATSDQAIMAIGKQVGYANRQRFGAMFTKYHGMSPKEFRHRRGTEI